MTNLPIPDNYQQLFDKKITQTKALFEQFTIPEFTAYPSPTSHFRMRAEFRMWHAGDELYHIMFDQKNKKRVRVDDFPIATHLINQAMQSILPLLKFNLPLRDKLFQIDYLSTLSGELLISLVYHKKLDEVWLSQAKQLRQKLLDQGFKVHLIGRAANQKISLDHDYVDEQLTILGRRYIYRQVENSFTQPNATINIAMLTWAINVTKGLSGDLLELYCGNGNFSIALAQNFNQVLATEVAKASVKAAQYNIAINQIENVKILRLSAEELTQAINNEREFKRLKEICLTDYHCHTVLVDPPRSGLDSKTLTMISQYQNIIYISCNPLTLKENLIELTQSHIIKKMAFFDQFPYTHHLECAVMLSKIG